MNNSVKGPVDFQEMRSLVSEIMKYDKCSVSITLKYADVTYYSVHRIKNIGKWDSTAICCNVVDLEQKYMYRSYYNGANSFSHCAF